MSNNNKKALAAATQVALEAGELLRSELQRPDGPRGIGESAVIDVEIEDLIRTRLTGLFPTYGFRAEERPEENTPPKTPSDGLWMVDPHDGTSAFLTGQRGACVSIALLRNNRPVLGVIYAYAYPDNGGDLITWAAGCGPIHRNGEPFRRPRFKHELAASDVVAVSKSADRRSRAYARVLAPARFRPMPGIAYRLALVAVGDVEAAISLNAPRDFDCAAGHALVLAAGGDLYDERARPVRYDLVSHQVAGFCFAGHGTVAASLAVREWKPCLRGPRESEGPYPLRRPMPTHVYRGDVSLARAQGAWLGQLTGDALGSQVECASAEQIADNWPNGVDQMVGGGPYDTMAGQPTDDSELARHLACSMIQNQAYDADKAALAYHAWYATSPYDMGVTTAQALTAVDEFVSNGKADGSAADKARDAANADSQANGAMMRVSPLAIFGQSWTEKRLAAAAREDATITHPHPVCADANVVFVLAMAAAIRDGLAGKELYDATCATASRLKLVSEVQDTLRAAADGPPEDFITNQGWVLLALRNAFHQLHQERGFAEAMVQTVSFGGDTDTNACIAGALLGAAQGVAAIPSPWVDQVSTCRPIEGLMGVANPRPRSCWVVDALLLPEHLLAAGESS